MVAWPVEQALITALSFVSFTLVVIPLYWHLEGQSRFPLRSGRFGSLYYSLECGMCPLHWMGWRLLPHKLHQRHRMAE